MCLLLVLAIVFASAAQSHFIQASLAAVRDGLHVAGTQLVDGSGNPIVLRGVDISGTEFACAQGGSPGNEGWSIFGGQPEDTASTISALQKWRVNAVRVPLNEDCWLGLNGMNPAFGGAKYRAAILKFVQDLNNGGMYVIVDLHWNAPGKAVALSQQPMADEDHGPSFWNSVASVFAGDPNVVFDLYNEPFLYGSYFQNRSQDPWSCWLNGCGLNQYITGGQPYTKTYDWQTAGMQQLIDAVRATGASNVVIANGLNWANDDSGWLAHRPNDPTGNLAAGWHEYEGEQCAAVACWSQTIAPITQRLPVVVGETGDYTGSGCSLKNLPTFLRWADNHGVSYLAWTFNPWGYTHDVLITDWQGTPSACEGDYYLAHLAALAGTGNATPSPVGTAARPAGNSGAARPPSAGTNNSSPWFFYVAILSIGVVVFGSGLALATTVGPSAQRIPVESGGMRRFAGTRLRRSIRSHRSAVGIGVAACGAIFLGLSLMLLSNQFHLH